MKSRHASSGFTQFIEYGVTPGSAEAFAQIILGHSAMLADTYAGLCDANVQVSEEGERVLQSLQWASREDWLASAEAFSAPSFCQMLHEHSIHTVRFDSYRMCFSPVFKMRPTHAPPESVIGALACHALGSVPSERARA